MPYLSTSFPDLVCDQFSSSNLIVACVGVGNVAQLTCDLLIHNLDCNVFSSLDLKYCPSVFGINPYGSSKHVLDLMTTAQIYSNPKLELAVLQIRAPPFSGCKRKHVNELVSFLKSVKFKSVILLSSSYATVLKDEELNAPSLQYALSSSFNVSDRKRLEELIRFRLKTNSDQLDCKLSSIYYLPGCGIANYLFEELLKHNDMPVCLLNLFTSEGDNSEDALFVAQHLDNWLGLTAQLKNKNTDFHWSPPPSWSCLFGTDPVNELY
ncbi:Proteasome assembly chaperone 2 [Schistosoma japonicum]|uniref:Proteasome assembly chaperone 2 n=1 Tax=Schistosoma japonicum TaxID=6182 RepID=A0A4Z2D006_SCHJA|nr:Proteasome assembly chaperone 2 [Schistosoma japonicum]TNN09816.1 Proteasome assembly chaperone 2 [Schistosoma japonicum]